MQGNQERLQNLLISKDFSTFSLLEHKRESIVEEPQKPIGTDLDEYNRWTEAQGGVGLGEVIYDDGDDALDSAEFNALRNSGAYTTTE